MIMLDTETKSSKMIQSLINDKQNLIYDQKASIMTLSQKEHNN